MLVIAHRGNSSVAPENTLPAFQSALDAKADLVELDYYHSADGVPVVIHDKTLDRTTNAEEVFGQAEAGRGRYAARPNCESSMRVVVRREIRRHEVADAGRVARPHSIGFGDTRSNAKRAMRRRSFELLEEKKLIDQVVVQSFDWKFVAECRRLSPRLALGTL